MDPNNTNQFCAPSMMQMIWQMGEKFGELRKEMMDGMKAEVGKLTEENNGFKDKLTKMEKQMNEFVAKNAELEGQIVEKNGEMGKMKAEMEGLAKENEDSKQRVGKLAEENAKMKEEIGKMKDAFSVKNNELEVQIVGLKEEGQKLEKKTRQLEEQQKMFVQNKWNLTDCGPKLVSSGEEGLVIKHDGQGEWNCIRAILPISPFDSNAEKPSIAGYFEMQILDMIPGWLGSDINIGFCTQQFPLERKWLGSEENSIGINGKGGLDINGHFKKYGNNAKEYFKFGDVIGVGIIHSAANKSMKCFATCNGQLLGTLELPTNFLTLQLFPAASLFDAGDSIHANFGQQKWRYDPSQLLK